MSIENVLHCSYRHTWSDRVNLSLFSNILLWNCHHYFWYPRPITFITYKNIGPNNHLQTSPSRQQIIPVTRHLLGLRHYQHNANALVMTLYIKAQACYLSQNKESCTWMSLSSRISLSTFTAKVAAVNSRRGIVISFKGARRNFPMTNEQCTWPSKSTNHMYDTTPNDHILSSLHLISPALSTVYLS